MTSLPMGEKNRQTLATMCAGAMQVAEQKEEEKTCWGITHERSLIHRTTGQQNARAGTRERDRQTDKVLVSTVYTSENCEII
jgi:hypothetical protein